MLTSRHDERTFEVSGIVLKFFDLNEADRVFTVLTAERGILKIIVKGIRKANSRYSGYMDLLKSNRLQLYSGRTFHKLIHCESEFTYPEILKNYDKMMFGLLVSEILVYLCQEEDPQLELYQLTLKSFALISQLEQPALAVLWFELQMLQIIGFKQDFEHCRHCNQSVIHERALYFDFINSGLLCIDCKSGFQCQFIRPESIKFLIKLQKTKPLELPDMVTYSAEVEYLFKLFKLYIQHLTDRQLKTVKVIDEYFDLQTITL